MDTFDDIRPYRDDEVPAVLGRLVADPAIQQAVGRFTTPRLNRIAPRVVRWRVRRALERRTSRIRTVHEFQQMLEGYVQRLIATTTEGLTVSGRDTLPAGKARLYVANHRDIVLDSALMNYALWLNGEPTTRIAIGDNLLAAGPAGDLMRLNKSFVVRRAVKGTKAAYAAMAQTSRYIRRSLEEGESIWIAQREGRAKDGLDRTDPALIKMLSLAYRDDADALPRMLARCAMIPVSVSYELDPCDALKAHELAVRETTGTYEKSAGEDLTSIVTGITGYKGRIHLAFGAPVVGAFDDADSLAARLDRDIARGLVMFPTHVEAAKRLGLSVAHVRPLPPVPRATREFEERVARCPAPDLRFLLQQYANPVENQRELAARPHANGARL